MNLPQPRRVLVFYATMLLTDLWLPWNRNTAGHVRHMMLGIFECQNYETDSPRSIFSLHRERV